MVYTDGIAQMAESKKCYWLLDIVASVAPKLDTADSFHVCTLHLDGKGGAVFEARPDTDKPPTYRQIIPHTDIDENVQMYFIDGVLLLPSEY